MEKFSSIIIFAIFMLIPIFIIYLKINNQNYNDD